jgi:hypothetical protein
VPWVLSCPAPPAAERVDLRRLGIDRYGPGVIAVAAVVVCVVLSGLAVFQLALVAGAPLGRFAWGGGQAVLSPVFRVGSAVSVVAYAVMAWLVWRAVGQPGNWWIWVLTAYFGVGVAMNAASRSRQEQVVMTPVALLLAVGCLVVALG